MQDAQQTPHWLEEHYADEQGIIRYEGFVIDPIEMGVLHVANPDRTSTVTTWRNKDLTRAELLTSLSDTCGWCKPWALEYKAQLDDEFGDAWEYCSNANVLFIQGTFSYEVSLYDVSRYEGKVWCTKDDIGLLGIFETDDNDLIRLLGNLRGAAERLWGNG